MNKVTNLTAWLWYAIMVAQPLLLSICLVRGIHKKNVWFPRYLFVDFSTSLFLLSVHNYGEYAASFYLLAIVSACCKFGILARLISQVFGPYETLPNGTMVRLSLGIVSTIGTFSAVIFGSHASNLDQSINFLRTADSALAASVLCGFWFVVIYARKLGLYWRSQSAGVAVGFLFYSSVQTATKLVMFHASPSEAIWVRNISQLAYLIALFVWIGFMAIPEPVFVLTKEDAAAALGIVRHAEETLRRIHSLGTMATRFAASPEPPLGVSCVYGPVSHHNVSSPTTIKRRQRA